MCSLSASLLPLQLEHFCYLYWLFLLLVLTFILYFGFFFFFLQTVTKSFCEPLILAGSFLDQMNWLWAGLEEMFIGMHRNLLAEMYMYWKLSSSETLELCLSESN